MQEHEMDIFIKITGNYGDIWTKDQVRETYRNVSLAEALNERKKSYSKIANIIHDVITA